jgi:hypothetical protein
MLIDQAGELIADVMTANRSLSSIPSASAILDASNYTFHAISYGKDADGFRHHAHEIINTVDSIIPSRKTLVIFGGADSSGVNNQTWELSGTSWSSVSLTTNPGIRIKHSTAYDSTRGRLVLFGGYSGNVPVFYGDTWELSSSISSTSWNLISTSGPSPREGAAMAYDSISSRTLLFGGRSIQGNLITYKNDLWSWDGTNWTELVHTNRPSARAFHKIVFDSSRNRLVLFGGGISGGKLGDTWEWGGSSWTRVSTTGPSSRQDFGMVYDSYNSKTVLYGGEDSTGASKDDVWSWNGTSWSQVTPTGAGGAGRRKLHGMVFCPDRNQSLVFGGFNPNSPNTYYRDTWAFNYTVSPFWSLISTSGPSGRIQHSVDYFDNKNPTQIMTPNDGIIKVLSYEPISVSSYHTLATASGLFSSYKLLPNSIKPTDTRLESNSTVTLYSTNVPDVGHCLNSYLNSNLSSYSHLVGCFPAASGTKYWMISSTFNPSSNIIISGTLSSVYNQQKIMDMSGFLTFVEESLAVQNELLATENYLSGALRTTPNEFPQKIRLAWGLYPGDAGSLLLFGGIYHLGLWYLDLKEMLKQGYYPPYNFNALNNIRKYKLFAKKTFNKDLLYLNDNGSNSGFKSVFEQNALGADCIKYIWDIKFY